MLFDGDAIDDDLPDEDEIYDSIEEIPDMDSPVRDGDDSIIGPGKIQPIEMQVIKFAAVTKKKRAVVAPFTRPLAYNSTGIDVDAVKRGLGRVKKYNGDDFMPWKGTNYTNRFNLLMQRHLKEFQKATHVTFQGRNIIVPQLAATGIYNKPTHDKLKRFIDAYGRAELVSYLVGHTPKTVDLLLTNAVNTALYDIAHNWQIHYTQGPARMYGVRNGIHPPGLPLYEDCSSDVTYLYWEPHVYRDNKWHQLPDPNGFGFNGWGFTGSMLGHGRVLNRSENVRMGDLAFYGPTWDHITHVTFVLNLKPVSWNSAAVSSHGGEYGPLKTSMRYRPDLQRVHRYAPIP
jgi:hypothetical protein